MLPGDIDLTENLDFRNVKQLPIPRLPESWNDIDCINSKINDIADHISYTTTIRYYNSTSITISTQNINSSWVSLNNYTDNSEYNYVSFESEFDDIESLYNPNISISNTYINTTRTDSPKKLYLSYKKEDEYDIFGNKKVNNIEYIPQLPWSTEIYNKPIRKIPWDTSINSEEIYEDIPWDIECDKPKKYDLSNVINRAKHLIPWLSDKSQSFLEDYLNLDEDKSLSYLTNMSWIGVRDAIIDIV